MPYKFEYDGTPMPRNKDRRVKLTEEQRREIRESSLSQQKLADYYHVSRRLIQFVKDPEKQAENIRRRLERGGWMQYYDKDAQTTATREHRRYKQLVLKGA